MDIIIGILIFQGLLGGYDVFWNHKWKEKLPTQRTAATEQKIHCVRELFYAIVFVGLAWLTWHGIWAWIMPGIILLEVFLTAWDFVVEDQTRTLSPNERITHLILSMAGGAYVALLIPVLYIWSQLPSQLVPIDYGYHSWILSIFGIGVFPWGFRDLLSGYALSTKSSYDNY